MFVLDEADEMLDMGFRDDIELILRHTPKQRQTLLFSAIMRDDIKKITNSKVKEKFWRNKELERKRKL